MACPTPRNGCRCARDIARSHGLPDGDLQPFATGTNLVVALDDRLVLKIFPPMLRAQFNAERGALTQFHSGGFVSRFPGNCRWGARRMAPISLMTRLSGVVGADAWPTLPEAGKRKDALSSASGKWASRIRTHHTL